MFEFILVLSMMLFFILTVVVLYILVFVSKVKGDQSFIFIDIERSILPALILVGKDKVYPIIHSIILGRPPLTRMIKSKMGKLFLVKLD